MICAILLAAGRSRRMGTQKLLLAFAGQTVIGHIADELLRSAIDRVIAVVGPAPGAVLPAIEGRGMTIATNPLAEGEMLSSVRCGLREIPAGCDAILVALGDQPAVGAKLIGRMIDAYRRESAAGGQRGIVVPVHAGRRGHPLLFSSRYVAEILSDHDAAGLRGLLLAAIIMASIDSPLASLTACPHCAT